MIAEPEPAASADTKAAAPSRTTRSVVFLLVSGFALMSYASVVEPLRAANRLSGGTLYRWRHATPDGAPATSSCGVAIPAETAADAENIDMLVVVAASDGAHFNDANCLAWLRSLARRGVHLGGVSGGPFILARAGVLHGHRCTVHWDHHGPFVEQFPDLDVTRSLYEVDRQRFTCAGGIAGLDMMHGVIAAQHGHALASAVSDWFLSTQVRAGNRPQRMEIAQRYGTANGRLISVLERMEDTVEKPCRITELARLAGVSSRQLERLFQRELGHTMRQHYMALRLERGRALLAETRMSIAEIAAACGFATGNHFSTLFRKRFGKPPSGLRARNATLTPCRPEPPPR